jgi:hypothetical protein
MRRFAWITILLLLFIPSAWAKVTPGAKAEECHGLYAKIARLFQPTSRSTEPFPFEAEALENAIRPALKLSGYAGMVNKGLWHYTQDGQRYFVKALGSNKSLVQAEIANARAMAKMGIGPKVHAFHDEANMDYLIFDHVPGINAKNISVHRNSPQGLRSLAPAQQVHIRESLSLSPKMPWPDVEKIYVAELYERRTEIAQKLRRIRQTLHENDFRELPDFQFMIHFERGAPGVEIQVIDSTFLARAKPPESHVRYPIDEWIQSLENWNEPPEPPKRFPRSYYTK